MRRAGIKPQALADTSAAAEKLRSVAQPSDNFKNLFEAPVLFYVAVLTVYSTQLLDIWLMSLAVAYVVLRYLHSFIHVSYNRVIDRFTVYFLSTLVLWLMWVYIGIRLTARVAV